MAQPTPLPGPARAPGSLPGRPARRRLGARCAAVAAALAAAALAAVPQPAWADTKQELEQARQRQQQLQQQAEQVRGQLGVLEDQVRAAERELAQAQAEHEAAWNQYLAIKARKEAAERELRAVEDELGRVRAKLASQQQLLARRVRSLYMDGRVDYLDVLFGSTSFSDFLSRWDLLQAIVRHDSLLVAQIKETKAQVEARMAEAQQRRDQLALLVQEAAQKNNEAAQKKLRIDQKRQDLEARRQQLRAVYDALDRENERVQALVAELERRYAEELARQRTGGLALDYPVRPAIITDPYGWRMHPILGERRMHWGTDFAARMGQEVRAAESGTVILAGWQGAYGLAVIIAHGTDAAGRPVSTLYAHNSQILVSPGQQVRKGQVIALAGSTGWSTGPHVHFEVRIGGQAVDPMQYLPPP